MKRKGFFWTILLVAAVLSSAYWLTPQNRTTPTPTPLNAVARMKTADTFTLLTRSIDVRQTRTKNTVSGFSITTNVTFEQ